MTKSEQLRKRRVECLDKAHGITTTAESGDDELTSNQFDEVKGLMAQATTLAEEIKAADERESAIADLNAQRDALDAPGNSKLIGAGEPDTRTTDDSEKKYIRVEGGQLVAEDDPKRGFEDVGEFASKVFDAGDRTNRGGPDQRLYIGAAATGMGQTTGADGGFAVPPAFSTAIWDAMNVGAENLLGRTDSYTVSGESLTFIANAETSRVAGSRWGGARGYWIDEADQVTASKPTLRQIKVEPHQLAVLVYATDKLLRNNQAGLAQYITRAASAEINFLIGNSIINGDGSGKPVGILNSPALVSVTAETGQVAATILHKNIIKMWARCHANSRQNAVWFINQDIEPQLHQMTLGVGTSELPSYLPPGGLSASPYGRLMGKDVVPIEYCPTLGTVGDIILADMKAYVTGTQGGLDSASSMHLRFDYLETAFRFSFAVDGQSWLASAITPFKGTNTLSPFVALATRS